MDSPIRNFPMVINEGGRELSVKLGGQFAPDCLLVRDRNDPEVVVIVYAKDIDGIREMLLLSQRVLGNLNV